MSIKRCLGLHKALSREVLFAWLYELSPNERAEIFLLRILKKTQDLNFKIRNKNFFLNRISNCERDDVFRYLNEELSIKGIKEKLLLRRARTVGISYGKPFETLNTNDIDWIRFVSKELDIYRWKGKICSLCQQNLSTDHINSCEEIEINRVAIKTKTGIDAKLVLEDPSILNKRSKVDSKHLKSFGAGKISKMIHAAGRSVIG